jgi:hypothetical protein
MVLGGAINCTPSSEIVEVHGPKDRRALDATLVVKCSDVQSSVLTTGACRHPTPIRVGRITGPPHLAHKDRLSAAGAREMRNFLMLGRVRPIRD